MSIPTQRQCEDNPIISLQVESQDSLPSLGNADKYFTDYPRIKENCSGKLEEIKSKIEAKVRTVRKLEDKQFQIPIALKHIAQNHLVFAHMTTSDLKYVFFVTISPPIFVLLAYSRDLALLHDKATVHKFLNLKNSETNSRFSLNLVERPEENKFEVTVCSRSFFTDDSNLFEQIWSAVLELNTYYLSLVKRYIIPFTKDRNFLCSQDHIKWNSIRGLKRTENAKLYKSIKKGVTSMGFKNLRERVDDNRYTCLFAVSDATEKSQLTWGTFPILLSVTDMTIVVRIIFSWKNQAACFKDEDFALAVLLAHKANRLISYGAFKPVDLKKQINFEIIAHCWGMSKAEIEKIPENTAGSAIYYYKQYVYAFAEIYNSKKPSLDALILNCPRQYESGDIRPFNLNDSENEGEKLKKKTCSYSTDLEFPENKEIFNKLKQDKFLETMVIDAVEFDEERRTINIQYVQCDPLEKFIQNEDLDILSTLTNFIDHLYSAGLYCDQLPLELIHLYREKVILHICGVKEEPDKTLKIIPLSRYIRVRREQDATKEDFTLKCNTDVLMYLASVFDSDFKVFENDLEKISPYNPSEIARGQLNGTRVSTELISRADLPRFRMAKRITGAHIANICGYIEKDDGFEVLTQQPVRGALFVEMLDECEYTSNTRSKFIGEIINSVELIQQHEFYGDMISDQLIFVDELPNGELTTKMKILIKNPQDLTYLAPEILEYQSDSKSVVYSIGLLTDFMIQPTYFNQHSRDFLASRPKCDEDSKSNQPTRQFQTFRTKPFQEANQQLYSLLNRTWNSIPIKRPTLQELKTELPKVVKNLKHPSNKS